MFRTSGSFLFVAAMKRTFTAALLGSLLFLSAAPAAAQYGSSATIQGTVLDPSGAAVKGATIEIRNAVSGFDRSTTTDDAGSFRFTDLPFNPYHLSVSAQGFQLLQQDVTVRTSVPTALVLSLQLATAATTVEVHGEAAELVEQTATNHTDVDRGLFDKVPLESATSSVSSLW